MLPAKAIEVCRANKWLKTRPYVRANGRHCADICVTDPVTGSRTSKTVSSLSEEKYRNKRDAAEENLCEEIWDSALKILLDGGELTLIDYLQYDAEYLHAKKWSNNYSQTAYNALQQLALSMDAELPSYRTAADVLPLLEQLGVGRKTELSVLHMLVDIFDRLISLGYLQTVHPGIKNPIRMRSEAYDAARQRQRAATAEHRTSQTALDDIQQRTMLRAFLEDIRGGDYRGVTGIIMLESGRRPSEAGATTLGMHICPQGEKFYTAPCYAVAENGIVNQHKTYRSDRQIPDSPVLAVVYEYIAAQIKEKIAGINQLSWETIPFGCRLVQRPNGKIEVRPFQPKQISAYVRSKLEENHIEFKVAVNLLKSQVLIQRKVIGRKRA
mgnify:CR=1 FL=1